MIKDKRKKNPGKGQKANSLFPISLLTNKSPPTQFQLPIYSDHYTISFDVTLFTPSLLRPFTTSTLLIQRIYLTRSALRSLKTEKLHSYRSRAKSTYHNVMRLIKQLNMQYHFKKNLHHRTLCF